MHHHHKGKHAGGSAALAGAAAGAGAAATSTTTSGINSDAIRAAIKPATMRYDLSVGPDKAGEHSYAFLNAESFQVRGPTYMSDKVKVASAPAAFDLMGVELFTSNDKIGNVAARQQSFLRRAREAGDPRFYLVILYVTPSAPFVHVAFYYAVNKEKVDALPHLKKVWARFVAEGKDADAFRNERWKVIPRVAEGSWIVQSAVGTKPALLAQKLTHTWIICDDLGATGGAAASATGAGAGGSGAAGVPEAPVVETSDSDASCGAGHARGSSFISHIGPGPYIEGDCDVSSSTVAQMLVGLLQSYAKNLVIDLGFAIEPRSEEECPEVVLGAVRLSRIDVSKPPLIKAQAGDWVLGTLGVTHADPEGAVGAAEAADA